MKKLVAIFMAVCLLFLVGCKKNGDNLPPEPELFGFSEVDFAEILFEDIADDILIDLSANAMITEILENLYYTDGEGGEMPATGEKYSLYFGGKSFTVYESGAVWYNDGENAPKQVLLDGEGLSYLDTLTSGDVFALDGYSEAAEIKAYNDANLVAEITEKGEFLANLNEVKVIKLLNRDDYLPLDVEYTIKIGNVTIKIYESYIEIGNDIFAVCEGDFEFLSDLTYKGDSSGFLPWV